jgi:hypothetical protein
MDVRGYRAKGHIRVGRGCMCPEGASPWRKWRPCTILQLYPGFHFTKEEDRGEPESVSPRSVRNTSLRQLGLLFRGDSKWPAAWNCYPLRPLQTPLFSPRSGQALAKLPKLATSTYAANCTPLLLTSRFCGRQRQQQQQQQCAGLPTDITHFSKCPLS